MVFADDLDKEPTYDEDHAPEDRRAVRRVFLEMAKLHVRGANVDSPTEMASYAYPPKAQRNGADPAHFCCAAFAYRDPITAEDLARLSSLPHVIRAYVQLIVEGPKHKDVSKGAVVVEVRSAARERTDAVQAKVFEVIDAVAPPERDGGGPAPKRKRGGLLGLLGLGGSG